MQLVFASSNAHKIKEIAAQLVHTNIQLIGLQDIGFEGDIPETQPTIEGNAQQKVRYITDRYALNCFAEDTGLIVAALNGEPGVHTARYAGESRDPAANMNLVMQKLEGANTRRAYFKTVIALVWNEQEYFFEGICNGLIIKELRGTGGFGYDPIFIPDGYDKTFAELPSEVKNLISHRGIATQKLINFFSDKQLK